MRPRAHEIVSLSPTPISVAAVPYAFASRTGMQKII
jgi:hypothetical protein